LAINKRKILESAQKNLQKGLLDKAVEDYRTLLKADPHDSNVLLKLGDLYLKQGKREESLNAYARVAQQFTREGFDAKAVALYKQITRLDPKRHDVCVPLAELYARMGLVGDAIASLQTAADAAYRAGHKDEALELLRRMAALDPSNTPNRLKVAELLGQEGRKAEALTEYEAVADELQRRGEEEERIRVVERILGLEPERAGALREVANARLAQSQFAAAAKLAERLVGAHPEDVEGFELLGHALLGAGDGDRARDVFRDLAERYRLRGDDDRARDLMQRFGGLESLAPDDAEAPLQSEAGLLELDSEIGGDDEFLLDEEPLAAPAPAKSVPLGRIDPVPALKRVPRAPEPPPAAPPPAPAPAPPAAPADFDATDPGQLLAEATVYQRYGKHERAVGALRAILAREPGHRPALEQLGEALCALGETAHAATAWQRAAEAAAEAGDAAGFARVRERLASIDAAAAAALAGPEPAASADSPLDDVEIDLDFDEAFASREAPAPATSPDEARIEVGDPADAALASETALPDPAAWSPDASMDADEAPRASADPEPPAARAGSEARVDEEPTATTPAQLAEQLEEAEFYLEQGLLDEARVLYDRILAAAPNHPQAMLRLGEIAARSGGAPAAPALAATPQAPAAPASAAAPAFEEMDLGEEIEFALDDAPAPAPRAEEPPPRAKEAPSRAEEPPPAAAAPRSEATEPSFVEASPAAEPEPAGDFDLAAELAFGADDAVGGTLAGTEEEGFEQVFNAFKSGVERELGEGDHEARYDLGIAYKEMGLLDDAIAEFRIAMQCEARRLSCLHMMGLCALELGRAPDAVAHLEQALSLPDLPDDQRVPLRYDLGRAYAAQRDVARARAAFEDVRAADAGFGDVARELAALDAQASTPAPAEAEADEAYESFDDLLAEEAPAPSRYESFDDLFAEGDEAREEPGPLAPAATDVAPPAEAAAPEPVAPVAEPEPEPEPEAAAAPATGRKRRKISFV